MTSMGLGRRFAAAILLAAALALALPAAAWAKSYTMPAVSIDARVAPDGSMEVRETRAWDFTGDFTRVYWDLSTQGVRDAGRSVDITDIQVSEDGTAFLPTTTAPDARPPKHFRVTRSAGSVHVDAYDTMTDRVATFVLSYKVSGAAFRWADTAELYWQFVGDGWTEPTGKVDVTIHFPAGVTKDAVQAWAHGPLTGTVHIADDGSVALHVDDLPPATFVEARVLFPADSLSGATADPRPRLAAAQAEEASLASAANQARVQARQQVLADERQRAAEQRVATLWGSIFGLGAPLIALGIVIFLWARYGKEYKPEFTGEYLREDPADLQPGLVSYLMDMGSVSDQSVAAAVMDLADRGYVRMEPSTVETSGILGIGAKTVNTYLLTYGATVGQAPGTPHRWEDLNLLDQQLLSMLFTQIAGGSTLTIEQMKAFAKASPSDFQSYMNGYKAAVTAEADRLGFVEKSSRSFQALAIGLVVLGGIATFVGFLMSTAWWVFGLGLVIGIPGLILAVNVKRRSPAAAELFAKYSALRRFLKDFSRLQDVPPASVVLWNRFLVLAVVFNIAREVIEQMRVRVPAIVSDPAFANTYWWVYGGGPGYDSPVSSLSVGLASAASIASSELSSSSGGGGGFSGGGGFGGGGGGGGAD